MIFGFPKVYIFLIYTKCLENIFDTFYGNILLLNITAYVCY